jgi:nucleoside-diphosphate-sugar epimerase
MNIVVTGGFGNVGKSTVKACLEKGHSVTILEAPAALKNAQRFLHKLHPTERGKLKITYCDIRNYEEVENALHHARSGGSPDAIVHLAALIPPASDRNSEVTWQINVGGTKNVIDANASLEKPARLVLASSIATYGDRLEDFWIRTSDAFQPSDIYSKTKIESENLVLGAGVPALILRLSYVVSPEWLQFDPLMFSMPPQTRLEVVHTVDAGRAFAQAATLETLPETRVFDIGGGAACRTTFRAYLDRIFSYFGLGDSEFLPDCAFAQSGFHCGWYEDSDFADSVLHFRSKSLEDYYQEVQAKTHLYAPWVRLVAPAARSWVLKKSPFLPRVAWERHHDSLATGACQ